MQNLSAFWLLFSYFYDPEDLLVPSFGITEGHIDSKVLDIFLIDEKWFNGETIKTRHSAVPILLLIVLHRLSKPS